MFNVGAGSGWSYTLIHSDGGGGEVRDSWSSGAVGVVNIGTVTWSVDVEFGVPRVSGVCVVW